MLDSLGEAASKLRGELGESLATVQRFDVPLEQATTSSLEALKAYSRGDYQKAIELDPNFALAYSIAGNASFEEERQANYITRAFQLREHARRAGKLTIAGGYYQNLTGELNEAERVLLELIDGYPRPENRSSVHPTPQASSWERAGMRLRGGTGRRRVLTPKPSTCAHQAAARTRRSY